MVRESAAVVTDQRAGTAPESARAVTAALAAINGVLLGKEHEVQLALCCLLARGHLLIEDLPGVGKTTLAQALARVMDLPFRRIQFTSDLLPADVLGVSVYDSEQRVFRFHPGPVFSPVLLADEINRATPKAQSALLEAMEERQVTSESGTLPLPDPFFVVATQNPQHYVGTYPLPESQLDRFLMRIALGYPDRAAERRLLDGTDRRELVRSLEPACRPEDLLAAQREAASVHASDALLEYLQDVVAALRETPALRAGPSPRAAIALLAAARAWALLAGRHFCLPEDVQAVAGPVMAHRLECADPRAGGTRDLVRSVVDRVAVR